MEQLTRSQRVALQDEESIKKAARSVAAYVKLVEAALHPIIWRGELGNGVTVEAKILKDGHHAVVELVNTAGWRASVRISPRYVYRLHSRRPTGQVEAEVGGDCLWHEGAAVILRKDGTADTEKLTRQLVNGWVRWEAETRMRRQGEANELVADRINAQFPGMARATRDKTTPVTLRIRAYYTEAEAMKLLAFMKSENLL